jgi:8-oxo-dGTP pyrophosphatase MutT (NUDIX family)
MPHIHTEPGQIDRTANAFIVHVASKRVLLRLHDKYNIWLPPGGHIENYQTAPEAAIVEAKEEVGLDIKLWGGAQLFEYKDENYIELIPPVALNIHFVTPEHRHEDHTYFATTETMDIIEPKGHEKSGGCIWLTKDEVIAHPEIEDRVKMYALKALALLGK